MTDIHTTLAANPWPTVHNPMPRAFALGNNTVQSQPLQLLDPQLGDNNTLLNHINKICSLHVSSYHVHVWYSYCIDY